MSSTFLSEKNKIKLQTPDRSTKEKTTRDEKVCAHPGEGTSDTVPKRGNRKTLYSFPVGFITQRR
jgi:hypothetical protein